MTKRIYKTMQGREIDLDALRATNETVPAVGNAKMNARGDELGPGGAIVRTRESVVAEYYEDNPSARPQESVQKAAPVVATQVSAKPEGKKKQ